MCRIFPASSHTYLMTQAPPPSSIPHLLSDSLPCPSCYTCPASASSVQPSAGTAIWLRFAPCGREGVNTSVLYLYVLFLPRNGAVVKEKGREGPERKLQWARGWWKKCLHNFICFPTTLFLVELPHPHPGGERSRLYWGWEFVTLIMPWTTWLCSSWNFQQGKKNVVFITVSLRDLYWSWDH